MGGGGDCLKRGLGQFANLRGLVGAWQEREGWCFFLGGRGVDTPMHTMNIAAVDESFAAT